MEKWNWNKKKYDKINKERAFFSYARALVALCTRILFEAKKKKLNAKPIVVVINKLVSRKKWSVEICV